MNPIYPPMQRIADLQQFVADFARIERVPQLANTGRPENDVEHSYGLALTCWYLASKIAPELSLEKIFAYALAHDTVEIHAGDTFVFGNQADIASKSDREDAAIAQLRTDWADFPEMATAAEGYKNKVDDEAKFVKAVDKILPVLMINLGEKDAFWERHKITYDMEVENKHTIEVSDIVAPYYQMLLEWIRDPDYFYKPSA